MPVSASLPPASVALPETAVAMRRFERASATFDAACAVHDYARDVLLNRLAWFDLEPSLIVDAGCATGRGAEALHRRFPNSIVAGLDRSGAMLAAAMRREPGSTWLRADVQSLPLPDGSVDLLLANLILPWCEPLTAVQEFARVLAPDGLLLLSTTGPRTLEQVRRAWREVDEAVHVHAGLDPQTLGDLIVRAGLREPVIDSDCVTLQYSGADALHAELRRLGAVNAAGGRRRSLTGRARFAAYRRALCAAAGGPGLDISAQFVFAQAFGPAPPEAPSQFRGIPVRLG